MNTVSRIIRLPTLLSFLPALTLAAPLFELELTGNYDDAGTLVTAAPDQAPGVVSLHAMLSLEFVPGLARQLQDQTDQVRLVHEGAEIRVEVVGRDEETLWRATWKQGQHYALRDGRVYLHLKPGRFGNDEFMLVLSSVTEHRLLQLEVKRMKPTFFGPVYQPMGTYLFHRVE